MVLLLFLKCWEAGENIFDIFQYMHPVRIASKIQKSRSESKSGKSTPSGKEKRGEDDTGGKKIYKVSRFKGNIASDPRG